MNVRDMDIEDILGYNPKRMIIVPPQSDIYQNMLPELRKQIVPSASIWRIKTGSNFYWVLRSSENETRALLFKYYGNIDDLEFIKNREPISRKVSHHYRHFNNRSSRVTSVIGYDEIRAILNYYSASSKPISHQDQTFMQLKPGMILYENFIGSCKIYPDLETYDYEQKIRTPAPRIMDESVFDYSKNIQTLAAKLNIEIDLTKKITSEDLVNIASKSFDYHKKNDLAKLYVEYCSLMIKYLTDNGPGKPELVNNELFFVNGMVRYDIEMTVGKTLEYLINYEYNPELYFQLFEE